MPLSLGLAVGLLLAILPVFGRKWDQLETGRFYWYNARMESSLYETTDREIIVDLLTAIAALAEKLTGERLTVYVKTDAGEVPICGGRPTWTKDPPKVASEQRRRRRRAATASIYRRSVTNSRQS